MKGRWIPNERGQRFYELITLNGVIHAQVQFDGHCDKFVVHTFYGGRDGYFDTEHEAKAYARECLKTTLERTAALR